MLISIRQYFIMNKSAFILSLLICFVCLVNVCFSKKYAYVTWYNDNADVNFGHDINLYQKADHVAEAIYTNKINETGWAFLEIRTSPNYTNEKQSYSAGFIEGYLTADLIWMNWQNVLKGFCVNKTKTCKLIEKYVIKNQEYVASMISGYPTDPYWFQVKLFYTQLEGLTAGYQSVMKDPKHNLSLADLLWLNMLGDLYDLVTALNYQNNITIKANTGAGHCSALVKLLPDYTDLYVSHVTWNSYQSMLRVQKKYTFPFTVTPLVKDRIPGHSMSFSSYPGFIQSTDDFYVISTGLITLETTISNSNESLYAYVRPNGQVLEFVRSMVANRLARNGEEWVSIFRKRNSGSYNNQWIVVDYKQFIPRSKNELWNVPGPVIKKGLLWVAEQLPGYVEAADLTMDLVANRYWPSYNIPYFKNIFTMSGGQERVKKFGPWFTYEKNPRAQMFAQRHNNIFNMNDMMRTMRYNDYKHDPLSRCNCTPPYSACNAISARNDLNPANGTYPFPTLGHRSHGGTDVKITNWNLAKTYKFVGLSSPTYNESLGIPAFDWRKVDFGKTTLHLGHPDVWKFDPVLHNWLF